MYLDTPAHTITHGTLNVFQAQQLALALLSPPLLHLLVKPPPPPHLQLQQHQLASSSGWVLMSPELSSDLQATLVSGERTSSSLQPRHLMYAHSNFPQNQQKLTVPQTLIGQGFNIFRLPFAMERMAPNGLTSALGAAYLANYTAIVDHITSKGAWAIVDPHNFGRYNGAIITDTAGFQTFWTNLAANYASNSLVVSLKSLHH